MATNQVHGRRPACSWDAVTNPSPAVQDRVANAIAAVWFIYQAPVELQFSPGSTRNLCLTPPPSYDIGNWFSVCSTYIHTHPSHWHRSALTSGSCIPSGVAPAAATTKPSLGVAPGLGHAGTLGQQAPGKQPCAGTSPSPCDHHPLVAAPPLRAVAQHCWCDGHCRCRCRCPCPLSSTDTHLAVQLAKHASLPHVAKWVWARTAIQPTVGGLGPSSQALRGSVAHGPPPTHSPAPYYPTFLLAYATVSARSWSRSLPSFKPALT
jgi:hypothetical protein